jgi:peptidoglycan/LPS O-acetylase OafA/YrhL
MMELLEALVAAVAAWMLLRLEEAPARRRERMLRDEEDARSRFDRALVRGDARAASGLLLRRVRRREWERARGASRE